MLLCHTVTGGILIFLLQPLFASDVIQTCSDTVMDTVQGQMIQMQHDDETDDVSLLQTEPRPETVMEITGPGQIIQASHDNEPHDVSLLQTHIHRQIVPEQRGFTNAFNCELDPRRCEEPINCDKAPGMATSGGAHPQAWCPFFPFYEDYLYECLVKKDLVHAGHLLYDQLKSGIMGSNTFEQHASYCFIEGHCLNTRVTPNTTLDEGSKMCDERFGRENWINRMPTLGNLISQASLFTESSGYTDTEFPDIMVHAACDGGMYHCDVIYCRETYCKDENMVKKYGHFLEDLGWKNSTSSWMHA